VVLVCPNCGDAKAAHKVEGGVRTRICKKCGQELATKK
jgi:large subunit ribosomal protein L24